MSKYTVYEELMYGDQDSGVCNWTGRLYHRGKGGVAAKIDGIAANREEAREAFKAWVDVELENYKVPEAPELVVITSTDVGKLEL